MDSDNLIFSSNIDPEVEEVCFDILLEQFSEQDFDKVYVKNVALAPNEIMFFVEIDGKESIIRIRVEND
jgi:hypothetical protein